MEDEPHSTVCPNTLFCREFFDNTSLAKYYQVHGDERAKTQEDGVDHNPKPV